MMFKLLCLGVVGVVFCVLLQGCGGKVEPEDGALEITFWHTQSSTNGDVLKGIISDFNESHPGIRIKAQYTGGYSDLFRKMRASISGGTMPALAVAYESMVSVYAKEGVVVDLGKYVDHPEHGFSKEGFEDIFPGYIKTNTFEEFGGKLLSFPFTKSNLMMYYNLDLIKKAGFDGRPETWKEFLEQCRAIRKVTGKPAYALSVDPSTIDGMIYSFGGELYVRENGKKRTLFGSPESLETFRVIETLVKEKLAFQINPGTYDDRNSFAAQRVAFMIRSSTSRSYLEDMIKDKFNWGLSEIPHGEGSKPVTVMFGANICMFKSTSEREVAAWKFIKYFTSPEVIGMWAVKTGYLPVRRSSENVDPFKSFVNKHPRNRAAFDAIAIARPEPNVAGWQEVRKHLDTAETQVVTGLKTAEDAVKELSDKANKVLLR